jgi:hypothetical protein
MAFPDYDGNGMFKSLGNVMVNPHVGLLFIAMHDKPKRLRVNGIARISESDPLLGETVGAQLIVRVEAKAIFPNCPRYIPNMKMTGPSIYAPQPKCEPLEPAWKSFDSFKDYVHSAPADLQRLIVVQAAVRALTFQYLGRVAGQPRT